MGSFRPQEGGHLERIMQTKQAYHTADDAAEAVPGPATRFAGARSTVGVPMLKNEVLIGAIVIYRQEVRSFSEKQIELVQNFAAQAVIAIENTRLLSELRESLQQQTATADVLRVISSSTGELEPVFNSMLANATRICEAKFGTLWQTEGHGYRSVALHGMPSTYVSAREREPVIYPGPEVPLARLAISKQVLQIADIRNDESYFKGYPPIVNLADNGGARTLLMVPMLNDGELVGAIAIFRQDVRLFTDKQIELVHNFAAQAVIAIENTRLLNELRESLQQQTATSEVLQVISSSLGDLDPVFQAVLEKATRICDANFGTLYRFDGGAFYHAAGHGTPEALIKAQRQQGRFIPDAGTLMHRVMHTRAVAHSADYAAESALGLSARFGGARSTVVVPMLKDKELVGAFAIYRQEVRPFTDKQIGLVANFAAQAVIAIENTRLLNELRESLQQQTATSEVLSVISSSPGRLEPVFQSVLDNAVRICEAKFGFMNRHEGDTWKIIAVHGAVPAYTQSLQQHGYKRPGPETVVTRIATTKQPVHIDDLAASLGYIQRDPVVVAAVELGGVRTMLGVPMLKDDELIGAILLYRQEVRPFNEKQIELVQNFAAQAVIAIENTRLLNELQQRTDDLTESLEQQTATSEVLKVISSSPGELEPIFTAMLENATRICEAKFGFLWLAERDGFRAVAFHNVPPALAAGRRHDQIIHFWPETPFGRLTETRQLVHVADIRSEPSYVEGFRPMRELADIGGGRTLLMVPMLKENEVAGAFAIYRQEVRPFTDKHVALVQNFAAQAVIAVENARLLNELRQRTDDLSKSLDDLRTAQDRLVQTQKLASLGQLTAGIAHEIKNPLNFVNNFSGVSVELIDELREAVKHGSFDDKTLAEVAELTGTLRDNLDKIAQHGKRADSIVKNMLLHSREGSVEHRPVDINTLVEESLNLAYHGARAEKQGFTIKFERSFDPSAGEADVFPQDITRVLLNLISNGFYAATKRKATAVDNAYEATVTAATRSLGDRVEIRIRDNGIGIPPDVREKMFNPFFTTKPTGEGTGLGLSISHDIIVKQHAGSIEVETEPGEFTEIKIILPRAVAPTGGKS
jgi:GAF domain-containing protein